MIELRALSFSRPQADGSVFKMEPLSLHLQAGSHWALVGENGVGKTSLALALIGGLENVAGKVIVNGKNLGPKPYERGALGAVFREPLLFEHLSVLENLSFSQARAEPQFLQSVIFRLGLEPLLQKRAPQLSSGQQQRVALGRALVARPRLLILDEPYDAIAAPDRAPLALAVSELAKEGEMALLLMSHDPREVFRHAQNVAVLQSMGAQSARLLESGSVKELSSFPGSLVTARLLLVPTLFERKQGEILPCFSRESQHSDAAGRGGELCGVQASSSPGEAADWGSFVGPASTGDGQLFQWRGGLLELSSDVLTGERNHLQWRENASDQGPGLYLDFSQAQLQPRR